MDVTKKNAFSDENLNDLFDLIHVGSGRSAKWRRESTLTHTICTLKVKNLSKCLKLCKTQIVTQIKALDKTNWFASSDFLANEKWRFDNQIKSKTCQNASNCAKRK